MDDHIARVDEHPIALRNAFDLTALYPDLFHLSNEMIDDGPDMAIGSPGGDHHGVGDGGFALEIYNDDVFGFVVIKDRQRKGKKLLAAICVFGRRGADRS